MTEVPPRSRNTILFIDNSNNPRRSRWREGGGGGGGNDAPTYSNRTLAVLRSSHRGHHPGRVPQVHSKKRHPHCRRFKRSWGEPDAKKTIESQGTPRTLRRHHACSSPTMPVPSPASKPEQRTSPPLPAGTKAIDVDRRAGARSTPSMTRPPN